MKLLAPSILSADFTNLKQQIRLVEMADADWIHCDIMDGHFVPNLTFGPILVKAVREITSKPVDCHLMVTNPDSLIGSFAEAGADYITVHMETGFHIHRTITKIKENGVKAGVAVNPHTPVSAITEIVEFIDLLLIMTVNPGFGGQSFIESQYRKIMEAAELREKSGNSFLIEVDGGIDRNNIQKVSDAGCDVFVAGSAVFKAENVTAAASEL
jgi:ribulose-phosphate 3-epimerase